MSPRRGAARRGKIAPPTKENWDGRYKYRENPARTMCRVASRRDATVPLMFALGRDLNFARAHTRDMGQHEPRSFSIFIQTNYTCLYRVAQRLNGAR